MEKTSFTTGPRSHRVAKLSSKYVFQASVNKIMRSRKTDTFIVTMK